MIVFHFHPSVILFQVVYPAPLHLLLPRPPIRLTVVEAMAVEVLVVVAEAVVVVGGSSFINKG